MTASIMIANIVTANIMTANIMTANIVTANIMTTSIMTANIVTANIMTANISKISSIKYELLYFALVITQVSCINGFSEIVDFEFLFCKFFCEILIVVPSILCIPVPDNQQTLKAVVSFIILIKLPRHVSAANYHLQWGYAFLASYSSFVCTSGGCGLRFARCGQLLWNASDCVHSDEFHGAMRMLVLAVQQLLLVLLFLLAIPRSYQKKLSVVSG
jgi:hypothetical protein